jgi:hypothetical protein
MPCSVSTDSYACEGWKVFVDECGEGGEFDGVRRDRESKEKKKTERKKPSHSRTLRRTGSFRANRIRAFESAIDAIEGIARRLAMGAHLQQTKQSDLAAVAILGDGDFLRVVQNILDDLGGLEGQRGSRADGGDSTILRLDGKLRLREKATKSTIGARTRSRVASALARERAPSRRMHVPQDRLRAGRTSATRSETRRTSRRPT